MRDYQAPILSKHGGKAGAACSHAVVRRRLQGVKVSVQAAVGKELIVTPLFHDSPAVEHVDAVGVADAR